MGRGERGDGEGESTQLHECIACSDIAEKVYRKLLESLESLNRLVNYYFEPRLLKSILHVDKCHERYYSSLYVHKRVRLSFGLR